MRHAARSLMIMPSPPRRHPDLDPHLAAEALASGGHGAGLADLGGVYLADGWFGHAAPSRAFDRNP